MFHNKLFRMKKMRLHNLVTTLVLVCMAAFWGCSSDDVDSQGPFIKADPTALAFEATTGDLTKILKVESNREWTAAFIESDVDSWITIDTKKGSGNGAISVTVLPNDGVERSATLKLTASTVSVNVKITQTAEGSGPVGEILYKEDCGAKTADVSTKPTVDNYTAWTRGGVLDQSGVTYSGISASVRAAGKAYAPTEGQGFSDVPYVYMGSTTANFVINKINVTGKTNLVFTCGVLYQSAYTSAPVFEAITTSSMKLQASVDGVAWADLTFTADGIIGWNKVSSEFKVPAGTISLYVKISELANADPDHQYRLDDFTILEGGNGALIKPEGGGETPGGGNGDVDPYPTTTVTSFTETFDAVVNNKPLTSDQWGFSSSDTKWPAEDAYLGWHGRIFDDVDKYLACAPYKSALAEVVSYAIMAPFNVSGATSKTLNFDVAWYYQAADNSKLEVVASTDFAGNVNTATWTVLKNCTFAPGAEMNVWNSQSVDLSTNYATNSKVYLAFRYTGKSITYRIDNIAFGTNLSLSLGSPVFSATTMKVGEAIVDGKITIPYQNAVGTESYNITVAVSGAGSAGIDPITAPITKTLTAGNGSIEIPITGTPTTAAGVTFTISGVTGLTTTTATGMVAADVPAGDAVYQTGFEDSGRDPASVNDYKKDKEFTLSGIKWKLQGSDLATTGGPAVGTWQWIGRVYSNVTDVVPVLWTDANLTTSTGEVTTVNFKANGPTSMTLKVYYSTDNGTTWNAASLTQQDGTAWNGLLAASYKDYVANINASGAVKLKFTCTVDVVDSKNRDMKLDEVVVNGRK